MAEAPHPKRLATTAGTATLLLLVALAGPGRVEGETLAPAPQPYTATDARIIGAFQSWKQLREGARLPFTSYASFLLRYPGWPDSEAIRRSAEGALDPATDSPSQTIAFFDSLPPLTNGGAAKYAFALANAGDRARAAEWARKAWRGGELGLDDETRLLGLFGSSLTAEDRDARADALLWAGKATLATRQLGLASGARQPLFAARIAMQTRAADAPALIAAAGPAAMADAGFVRDRALWLRATGQGVVARALLAERPPLAVSAAHPEKWYETLLSFAREAANDRQHALAYRIASRVDDALPAGAKVDAQPLGVRDDYTSLTWLAGVSALHQLGRPADAMAMFARYAGGARSPQTITKGHYWAARAAKAARDSVAERQHLEAAASHFDHYYGQLAAEALRRPLPPVPVANLAGLGAPQSSALFAAAAAASRVGSWQDQTRFLRAIANGAKTEAEHRAAIALAAYLARPDLAVMAGRNARVEGYRSLIANGFPTVTVPDGYQTNWSMIHAISRQESQFDKAAVSHAGARGLMQLMPGTARETAGRVQLSYDAAALTTDTAYNIRLGSTYFDRMLRYYGGSYPLAVAAYNAGPGNVNKWIAANGDPRLGGTDIVRWIEDIPIYETRNYVQRVLENAVIYDHLHPDRARYRGDAQPLSRYLGKSQPG